MGTSDPAIRFKQCTICAHKVTKASNSNIAQVGNKFSPYLDDMLILAQYYSWTLAVGFFEDLKPEGDVIMTKAKPRLL